MKKTKLDEKFIKDSIENDPDFINSKKYKYSLQNFLDNNRTTPSNNYIGILLGLKPEEVKERYEKALKFLREGIE